MQHVFSANHQQAMINNRFFLRRTHEASCHRSKGRGLRGEGGWERGSEQDVNGIGASLAVDKRRHQIRGHTYNLCSAGVGAAS